MTSTSSSSFTRLYLDKIRSAAPSFIESIITSLRQSYNLDITKYGESGIPLEIDHICYRTETIEEYKTIQDEFKENPDKIKLLVESIIGGRPISVYEFLEPLTICISESMTSNRLNDGLSDEANKNRSTYRTLVRCLELPSPKVDQNGKATLVAPANSLGEMQLCNRQGTPAKGAEDWMVGDE